MTALVKRLEDNSIGRKWGVALLENKAVNIGCVCLIRSKQAQQYKILMFVLFAPNNKNLAHSLHCTKRHPKWAVAYEQNYEMFFINETILMGTTECDKNNVIT